MTNPPFRSELREARRWCGDPLERMTAQADLTAGDGPETDVRTVVRHLEPIRSRTSLLDSYAREASPSQQVRTAYAIRWLELGSGIAATGIARSRSRRAFRA